MVSEWVTRRIGSLGRVVTGKTPSTVDPSNFGGPYPFITIPDLNGRVFIDRTERSLSEKGANALRTCLLPPGAVMMSCIATIGRCGITTRPSFTNQQINSIIPNSQFDSRFLYYVFTQLGHELESAGGGGSVYTNVSKSRFSDIEIVIPEDLPEQRAIAHILGTLDDKIELNRKQNETLEAMARALFKAWFVDFEPVRAKMEGRWQRGQSLPGLPAHLYELFPDRLVESELGEIPEGWSMRPVGDFADLQGGKQLEKDRIVPNGGIPVFGGAGVMGYTDTYNADGFVIAVGRVGAYCGQFFSHRGKAWINNNASLIRQKKEDFGEWLFLSLRHADIDVIKKGAAQPFVSNGDLSKLPLVWPSEKVVESFSQFTVPLLKGQEDANRESKFLALLRDTLLPKLISGELRIRDAERILEERSP